MDDGAGPEDDLAWAPPTGPREPDDPSDPSPWLLRSTRSEAGRLDRSTAALTAGLFGALAGITLPPLLFWITFSILNAFGAADLVTTIGALIVGFGVPILVFVKVMSMLKRSTPRFDGARTALTVAASVSMGMWVFVVVLGGFLLVLLRSMG
jgi:hypothetical protein